MADTFCGSHRAASCDRKDTHNPVSLLVLNRSVCSSHAETACYKLAARFTSHLFLVFQTCEPSSSYLAVPCSSHVILFTWSGWGGWHLPLLQIRKLRLRPIKEAAHKPHEAPGSSVSLRPFPISGDTPATCYVAVEDPCLSLVSSCTPLGAGGICRENLLHVGGVPPLHQRWGASLSRPARRR